MRPKIIIAFMVMAICIVLCGTYCSFKIAKYRKGAEVRPIAKTIFHNARCDEYPAVVIRSMSNEVKWTIVAWGTISITSKEEGLEVLKQIMDKQTAAGRPAACSLALGDDLPVCVLRDALQSLSNTGVKHVAIAGLVYGEIVDKCEAKPLVSVDDQLDPIPEGERIDYP